MNILNHNDFDVYLALIIKSEFFLVQVLYNGLLIVCEAPVNKLLYYNVYKTEVFIIIIFKFQALENLVLFVILILI